MRISPARIAVSFLIGFVIIFPLLNQSGVITIYEALAGIWAVFLIPAFFLFRTLSKAGNNRLALRFTAFVYILGSSLYSLVEPLIAGYNLGVYVFLIIIPASLIVVVPSFYLWYRSRYAHEKKDLQIDEELTGSLRNILAGIDENPPDVFIRQSNLRIGSAIVTHTNGPNPKIGVTSDAKGIYDQKEIGAAVLREYFAIKKNSALRLVFAINLSLMLYVDGIILLSGMAQMEIGNQLGLLLISALGVLVIGFIASFPYMVKLLSLRKELGVDLVAAKTLGEIETLKSLIRKGVDNYKIPAMITPRRVERMMAGQDRMAKKRIVALESLESGLRSAL